MTSVRDKIATMAEMINPHGGNKMIDAHGIASGTAITMNGLLLRMTTRTMTISGIASSHETGVVGTTIGMVASRLGLRISKRIAMVIHVLLLHGGVHHPDLSGQGQPQPRVRAPPPLAERPVLVDGSRLEIRHVFQVLHQLQLDELLSREEGLTRGHLVEKADTGEPEE